jgi:exodeoxyribonuclease-3
LDIFKCVHNSIGEWEAVKLKVCTFNVNSIRARKDLVTTWLTQRAGDIDVLCLQEIKVVDEKFPHKAFNELGFTCHVCGQKRYNGVAMCSKPHLERVTKGFDDEYWDQEKRLMTGRVGDITIINVYVPHGDVRGTEKYKYKLEWYNRFIQFMNGEYSPDDNIVVLGDFNVARDDRDVFDAKLLEDTIGTMVEERAAFTALLSWGLTDVFRYRYREKKQFTWWDYIGGAIWKGEGMRIDYVLCTKPLLQRVNRVDVDIWPRRRRSPTPSDHAPVIIDLAS